MKKLLTSLIIISSSMSFACPNLNGSFNKCTTGDRTLDDLSGIKNATLAIVHNDNEVTASFMGTTNTVVIGEVTQRTQYDSSEMATISTTATAKCDGAIFKMTEVSEITYDWGEVINSTTDSDIYFSNNNKNIVMDMTTTEDGASHTMTITCTRK